jgi:hypothetical protein
VHNAYSLINLLKDKNDKKILIINKIDASKKANEPSKPGKISIDIFFMRSNEAEQFAVRKKNLFLTAKK